MLVYQRVWEKTDEIPDLKAMGPWRHGNRSGIPKMAMIRGDDDKPGVVEVPYLRLDV